MTSSTRTGSTRSGSTRTDVTSARARISAARDFDDLRRLTLAAARRTAGADGATFVLRDGDLCFYVDEDAIGPLWRGQRFPMAQCISGWAMVHREVAVLPDPLADARIPVEAYRPTFVRSLVMVPMGPADGGEPVGAVGLYWARPGVRPDGDVLDDLRALVDAAGEVVRRLDLASAPWAPNFAVPGGDRPPAPLGQAG